MSPHNNGEIVHVQSASQLASALDLLAAEDFIALDTEFLRESTYYAKLCLVQAANRRSCVIFDIVALRDIAPLYQFLCDRNRIKVLHAARQDLEVLFLSQNDAVLPGPVFDTQVAAGLLGYPAQIGYGDLVAKRLGHVLEKGHARADWSRRPLSPEQLEYAADDVRYLVPLYENLKADLVAADRLPWLAEEMALLEAPQLYRTAPDAAWQRLRGTAQLRPEQRAALKRLAEWRELRAVEHDKPRGWILSDEALRILAERRPQTAMELERLELLPPAVLRKHADAFLQLIAAATADAAHEPPAVQFRPDNAQMAQVSHWMKQVRTAAERMKISPELLATRRDIEQWVYFNKIGAFGGGWRRGVIGETLLAERKALPPA